MYNTIRRYPLTVVLLCVVWILSFCTPPRTGLEHVHYIDKLVHTAMYGGTCLVMWAEYWRQHTTANRRKLALWAIIAPILMSGAIELLQEYATTNRSGDWLDLAANTLGVLIAAALGAKIVRHVVRNIGRVRNKDYFTA